MKRPNFVISTEAKRTGTVTDAKQRPGFQISYSLGLE